MVDWWIERFPIWFPGAEWPNHLCFMHRGFAYLSFSLGLVVLSIAVLSFAAYGMGAHRDKVWALAPFGWPIPFFVVGVIGLWAAVPLVALVLAAIGFGVVRGVWYLFTTKHEG